jgi:hypothetical protein
MIWFFDREGQRLRYEIRRTADDQGYELEVSYPDGRTEVEQMVEPSDLLQRCADLAKTLKADGWRVG